VQTPLEARPNRSSIGMLILSSGRSLEYYGNIISR